MFLRKDTIIILKSTNLYSFSCKPMCAITVFDNTFTMKYCDAIYPFCAFQKPHIFHIVHKGGLLPRVLRTLLWIDNLLIEVIGDCEGQLLLIRCSDGFRAALLCRHRMRRRGCNSRWWFSVQENLFRNSDRFYEIQKSPSLPLSLLRLELLFVNLCKCL